MNDQDIKSVIAIVSGGLDSTVMLWNLANNGIEVKEAISFNYGQRHSIELEHVKRIIEKFESDFYQINHKIVDITAIQDLISRGSLTGTDQVPKDMYDEPSQKITIVPNRNMIFISIAAGRAVTIQSSHVAYAAHASDHEVYPDCRPDFIEKMDEALYLGNLWDPVHLYAPFQYLTKDEVTKIGLQMNTPLHLTWSCYQGENRPCLECGTCLERTESFIKNKQKDPALTGEEWELAKQAYILHSKKET